MRSVAGLASIHPNAEMLEDEGASLIGVAVETGLLVGHCLINLMRARPHSPGRSKGAMRIMAVCARDHPFFNPVLKGHRELHPHVGMASFAKRGLGLAQ
jgi:hypothetical protein